ncbi:MAG: hypothetical protein ACHBN1_26980 [Heteroscytonema crispum UTEX LB 1556]
MKYTFVGWGRIVRPGRAIWSIPQENIECIGFNREPLYMYRD